MALPLTTNPLPQIFDMAFSKVNELATTEACALALVEFADKRFTAQELAVYLSSLLSDRLTAGTFVVVRRLVDAAVDEGMLQWADGTPGGEGFTIPASALDLLSNVGLPSELFVRPSRLGDE